VNTRLPTSIRSIGAAVAAIVLAATLAGCGGSSSSPSSSTSGGGTSVSGKDVFESNCATCHTLADAGSSGSVGPNLDDLKPDQATVQHQVTDGGGGMPAFGGQLSDAEIAAVAKYVSSVAGQG
jgi:mono/diheme cytochrome c family protein